MNNIFDLTKQKEKNLYLKLKNEKNKEMINKIRKIFYERKKEEMYYLSLNAREQKIYEKNYWLREIKEMYDLGFIDEKKYKIYFDFFKNEY